MNTGQITKPKLVKADFRVCCNHANKGSCINTVYAIRDKFNNIVEITATQPYDDNTEDMCVIGTAIIDPEKKTKFQRALKRLKIGEDNTIVKKAVVELVQ